MGLFSRKNKDEPEEFASQNQPLSDSGFSEPVNSLPGLPQNDQTAQNSNIDGILPATTQTGHPQSASNYTGFDEPLVQDEDVSDDQSQFIMDPLPIDEPINEEQGQPIAETNYVPEYSQPKTIEPAYVEPVVEQFSPDPQPAEEESAMPPEPTNFSVNPPSVRHTSDDDLIQLKAEALKQLTPLAGHLDQSPEEKFHTTMMMLQATDDQNLVRIAFEAANSITDEKSRAQALLDVVNEINYFTQNK